MPTVSYQEVLFEFQKRPFFSTYNHFDGPIDVVDEKKIPKKKEDIQLPNGWKWVTEWKSGGSDAWEYCGDWSNNAKDWNKVPGIFEYARRRKLTRTRMIVCTDEEFKNLDSKYKVYKEEAEIFDHFRGKWRDELKIELSKVTGESKRPNILLLGGSGAGKSSLVNAVFGKTLAEIGEGKPITQTYTKYSSEVSPVCIYDSRGIEHGYAQKGFSEDTEAFFKKLSEEPSLENHVHVVWYVLDLTQARFQPFEAEFCRTHLAKYPIIFVLNKADSVDIGVRDTMIKVVEDHNLPNIRGIFATIANCKNFDAKFCEKCKSGKIKKRIQGDNCTVMCKECDAKYTLQKQAGIKELAHQTLHVMPNLVVSVFVNSKQQEILDLEPKAKEIISQMADEASLKTQIRKELSSMLDQLLKLYSMSMIQKKLEATMIEHYVRFYEEADFGRKTWLAISDIFKKKSIASSLFIACGLEICRSVIHFKYETIKYAVLENETFTMNGKDESTVESSISNSVSILINPPLVDKDLMLETLFENMDVLVDSVIVANIDLHLAQYGNCHKFLKTIPLSKGTTPFGGERERKSRKK